MYSGGSEQLPPQRQFSQKILLLTHCDGIVDDDFSFSLTLA